MSLLKNKVFINEYFYEYLNNKSRYFVLYGGSGSGKSHFVAQKILFRCLNEKGHRILIVRKVAKTIKESVYKQLHALISEYGLQNVVTENKTDMSFMFTNGNEIITTGLDDPEKIKSIYNITSIWIEEATELEKGDFDQLDLRLRGETENYKQIILSFNPISETHWLKAELFDNKPEHCTVLHSTYKNNKFLDAEYIETLNKRVANDDNLYRIYVLGEWGRIVTGAEYYIAFDRKKHVKPLEYKIELPLHPSYDQNIVPYISCVIAQIEKINDIYHVNVLSELALSNPKNSTKWLCVELLNRYPNPQGIYYYGDASGNKQDTRNNQTDYDIIRTNFARYLTNSSDRTLRINPPHKKRRQFINAIFNDKLPIRVTIDPSCKLLITDLEYVKEDIDGGTLKEKAKDRVTGQTYEKWGHCFVGETLIETINGPKRIDSIKVGELVRTRNGYRKVTKVFDNGIKEVNTYNLNGHTITCTDNHKIYTKEYGYISVKDVNNYINNLLIPCTIFCIFVKKSIWNQKQLSTMDLGLLNTLNQRTEANEYITPDGLKLMGRKRKQGYIGINILSKLAKYLKTVVFTMLMVIQKTIISKTLNVLRGPFMLPNILKKMQGLKCLKRILLSPENMRENGMGQKMVESGILNTLKQHCSVKKEQLSVLNAEKNLLQHVKHIQNTVQVNAVAEKECEIQEYLEHITKKESVQAVEMYSQFINGVRLSSVQEVAGGLKRVYDIQVEDDHEYFANGILVHNCSDAMCYLLIQAFRPMYDSFQAFKI